MAACAPYNSVSRIEQLARDAGYQHRLVEGGSFSLVVYLKPSSRPSRRVHVYIEGDGTPWLGRRRIARNPTPHNPLMLKLMGQDPSSALYLGRPCYHGMHRRPPCHPFFWTYGRYSEEVVNSMAAVLTSLLTELAADQAVLIGHSGGGTLAMLLAGRIPATRAVITLAANLDTDAWAAYHDYTPLFGSLNPAKQDPLPEQILQLHLIGRDDINVPPALAKRAIERQKHARWLVFKEQNHRCCWEAEWPSLLAALPAWLDKPSPSSMPFSWHRE